MAGIESKKQNKGLLIIGFAMAHSKAYELDVYQPCNPNASAYNKCVEKHYFKQKNPYPYTDQKQLSGRYLAVKIKSQAPRVDGQKKMLKKMNF